MKYESFARWAWLPLLVMVALMLVSSAAPAFAQEEVLVEGDPPLTSQKVEAFGGFFEWLLDAPLTAGERQDIRDALVLAWSSGDRETIGTAEQITELYAEVAQLNEAERVLLREQVQPQVLDELRQTPDDPAAQWVLRIYDHAHTPLADGTPPLTRTMSDAYLELMVFTLSEAAGEPYVEPEQELKDAWAQALASEYGGFDPELQQAMGQMPSYWAAVRLVWPTLSEEEQAQLREQWLPMAEGMVGDEVAVADEPQADTAEPIEEPQAGTTDQGEDSQPAQDEQPTAQSSAAPSDYYQAYQKLQQERQTTAMISNMMAMQHETSMSVINNIGSSNYTYEYQWVYQPTYP